MNQTQTRSGPNLGLLLLIPAVVIVAKAASRHGGHRRFGAYDGEMGPRTFRLPPRIEAALDDWHARSHETTVATPTAHAHEPETPTA